MIKDKIKSLLALSNVSQISLANKRGISKQQLSTKILRGAFRVDDLIELANDTDTTLAFLDKNGKPVIQFDMDDIRGKNDGK